MPTLAAMLLHDEVNKYSPNQPRSDDGRFGAGDKVKITYGEHAGKSGVVTETSPSGQFHGVSTPGGKHLGYYSASDLKHR